MEVPMAVGVQIDVVGGTLAQYDEVVERMGYLPGGLPAPNVLFHWVTPIENGFRVVDVWESREAFDQFAREKMVPLFEEVGVRVPSEITYFEVHNYLSGGRWRR
jgi:hypothetical protein